MSTSSDKPGMLAAFGSAATMASGCSSGPAPDDRLAAPETRYEVIDGERVFVSPADELHATSHLGLSYLLRAHVAPGYVGAVDLLTRTSKKSDFAPDASVFPQERDPVSGGRQLEELAFEVASTQPLADATKKARGLSARGVRRVFCLHLPGAQVLEWERDGDTWRTLANDGAIADACFVRPLPVAALLDAARLDDEVARALLAKHNPVLEHELAAREARSLGVAICRVLEARGFAVSAELRQRVLSCADPMTLDRWLARAATIPGVDELFD